MAQRKMRTHNILLKDPVIAEHLPYMDWYSYNKLIDMLNKYTTVYVKPNRGRQGNNIIRIKSLLDNKYEIISDGNRKQIDGDSLQSELSLVMKENKKYIIQEGIDLATYGGNPFDMRIVLHKIYNAWQVTLTSARVARHKDDIITNVSKGAKDYLLYDILQAYDQKSNPMADMREIIDLSHRIAYVAGTALPIFIIGLDLALDKDRHIWLIEANLSPQCAKCRLVNDEISLRKYWQARKIIKEMKSQTDNI